MLNNTGFDLWSENYEKSVRESFLSDSYPFAGYTELLSRIYGDILSRNGKTYLDIGIGTGILAKKLYDNGLAITGIDFSKKMLAIAAEKMPDARLLLCDFGENLPEEIKNDRFDAIVCTYAIHHLDYEAQKNLLRKLLPLLSKNGRLYIGDVAFETMEELEACKKANIEDWDTDELYPVLENFKNEFDVEFEKISFCAGIFTFRA
ncbi:MAG: class I SAM-dependent methyltransferase [Clostridiales bacterium]|nr:class I SAM-dependent methyltransferase [Clostridiales bacterium]